MHGAGKDRSVACKPHVTEELRVNRGGVGRYDGFLSESFCSRLGCGGFVGRLVRLMGEGWSAGARTEKANALLRLMSGQMAFPSSSALALHWIASLVLPPPEQGLVHDTKNISTHEHMPDCFNPEPSRTFPT